MENTLSPDLAAARRAACECLLAVEHLVRVATGDEWIKPHPAAEELLGPLPVEDDRTEEQIVADLQRDLIAGAVAGLCKTLDQDCGRIEAVEQRLRRASAGPISAMGIVRGTAHRAAWDLAEHVWLKIGSILQAQAIAHGAWYEPGPDFQLDSQRIEENVEAIRRKVIEMGPCNTRVVKAAVEAESARAAGEPAHDCGCQRRA